MKALICGISGQDGSYLAKLLIEKGYTVVGTSRDAQTATFASHAHLGIDGKIQLESMAPHDFRSVLQIVRNVEPDEIYNLSGQSSVGLSFDQPVETLDSIIAGTLNLLEAIRFLGKPTRFYNAGSSECFGDTGEAGANEDTPFRPRSPYAVAKSTVHWLVANYREAYNLHVSTGILFNHESPIRPNRFVTRKIISAACRIYAGSKETLTLGNLSIHRDWGWAPEYVEAMWKMLQRDSAEDFVIATGASFSLEQFSAETFQQLNLDWQSYVKISDSFFRPTDITFGKADPRKAQHILGWTANHRMPQVVKLMIAAELKSLQLNPP